MAGRSSRRDRNTALLLQLHVVHGRRALVHFTDLVVDTCVEQHAFRRGRLTGVNVRHDPDVAYVLKRIFCHGPTLSIFLFVELLRSTGLSRLPLKVRERFICLSHTVSLLTPLY